MAFAYQVVMNGYGHTVTGRMDQAFDHIMLAVDKDGLPDMAKDHPMFVAAGVELSRLHRIRYAVEGQRWESVEVVMHDLDQKPGFETGVRIFDLVDEFDPSYLVTKFLLVAEQSDLPLPELADDLEIEIEDGILNDRKSEARREVLVGRYLDLQERLGGPKVIEMTMPLSKEQVGDILSDLPKLAKAKFVEMAAKAFPEEATSLAP